MQTTSKPALIQNTRWLRQHNLKPLFNFVETHPDFKTEEIGKSEEGRPLSAIYWGSGKKRLLIWTQMHGNEPTATLAIGDLIQRLTDDPELDALKSTLSLAIVPMLNPDGAELFQRRNALGIDLNRDAVARSSKEMQAFYGLLESFNPDWAFNMHDQRNIFSVGEAMQCATLSFLAPSPNEEREISKARETSMQLISGMYTHLESMLTGHFGRYTDEFYPKALGDNLMAQGIPNILFEAGHYPGDLSREKSRSLILEGLVEALRLIANDSWKALSIKVYEEIPHNQKALRDLILREVEYRTCTMDIALMMVEIPNKESDELDRLYQVVDIGDLSALKGIEEEQGGKVESDLGLNINQLANFRFSGSRELVFVNGAL